MITKNPRLLRLVRSLARTEPDDRQRYGHLRLEVGGAMTALAPREAYRLWAPTYATETAISFIEDELARALSPPPGGKRLLDAGCGTGRRLLGANAALRFTAGIDASFEMLKAGNAAHVAAADVRNLPFAAESFDLIWCRLVLGRYLQPSAKCL